jgi:hypothetical protein
VSFLTYSAKIICYLYTIPAWETATEAQKGPWIAEVGVAVTGGLEIKLNGWVAVLAGTFGATVGGELRKAFC